MTIHITASNTEVSSDIFEMSVALTNYFKILLNIIFFIKFFLWNLSI